MYCQRTPRGVERHSICSTVWQTQLLDRTSGRKSSRCSCRTDSAIASCQGPQDSWSHFPVPRRDHHLRIHESSSHFVAIAIRCLLRESRLEDGCLTAFCSSAFAGGSYAGTPPCSGLLQQTRARGRCGSGFEDKERVGPYDCHEMFKDHSCVWNWTYCEHEFARLLPQEAQGELKIIEVQF